MPQPNNTTIGTIFNHPTDTRIFKPSRELVCPDTWVGIEVELEGCRRVYDFADTNGQNLDFEDADMPRVRSIRLGQSNRSRGGTLNYGHGLWVVEGDGSLRNNGVEFKTVPVYGQDLVHALSDLENFIVEKEINPTVSDRCSVHIHLGVADLTFEELLHLLCNYIIFEELLFNYCEPSRKHNFYCMPYYKADQFYQILNSLWANNQSSKHIQLQINRFEKYSAVNLGALQTFGTIEFRHLEGCYFKRRLLEWINILMSLKKACINQTPETLPDTFSNYSRRAYGDEIFGEELYDKLHYPGCDVALYEGIRLVQDVLYLNKLKENEAIQLSNELLSDYEKLSNTISGPLSKFAENNECNVNKDQKAKISSKLRFYYRDLLSCYYNDLPKQHKCKTQIKQVLTDGKLKEKPKQPSNDDAIHTYWQAARRAWGDQELAEVDASPFIQYLDVNQSQTITTSNNTTNNTEDDDF